MATTTLYRFHDPDGALLYVGISAAIAYRLGQHAASKSWWPSVTSCTMEHFATREAAAHAERLAIALENPIHNIRRPARPMPRATARPRTALDTETNTDLVELCEDPHCDRPIAEQAGTLHTHVRPQNPPPT